MLEPKLSILDETDSGLDIDALRIVASGVNKLRSKDNAFVLITHYQGCLSTLFLISFTFYTTAVSLSPVLKSWP
jgi:Fe-S cluster assembly ATPase SufC